MNLSKNFFVINTTLNCILFLCSPTRQGKQIQVICKGFWRDPRHLANQFSYMSGGAPPLTENVADNLHIQLG